MKKKIVLVSLLLIEFLVSISIGNYFFANHLQNRRILGIKTITTLKKENIIASESANLKYFYSLVPNTTESAAPDWLGYTATYTYNNDALNERRNYDVNKPVNVFRIITLGDSFTFGQFVDTKDNWTEKLEDMLNQPSSKKCGYSHFEVINLGMPGYDVPYIIHRYETVGKKYDPDLIIWFEGSSGYLRNNELLFPIIKSCEKRRDEGQFSASEEVAAKKSYYYCWEMAEKKIYSTNDHQQITNVLKDKLDSFLATINHGKIEFITFSGMSDDNVNNWHIWQKNQSDVDFFDDVPNISALNQKLPDGHPSKVGHETIAKAIFENLEKNYFNECK